MEKTLFFLSYKNRTNGSGFRGFESFATRHFDGFYHDAFLLIATFAVKKTKRSVPSLPSVRKKSEASLVPSATSFATFAVKKNQAKRPFCAFREKQKAKRSKPVQTSVLHCKSVKSAFQNQAKRPLCVSATLRETNPPTRTLPTPNSTIQPSIVPYRTHPP
ncbi:MAG TPA: hypothetical protein PLL09_00540 [Flavobacterium sp.]|uniref:hypothetical protein n=1 Tax=unclassified Flavobacterium TaxID=196869 RepID=UPI0025B8F455|nr:MULTISPECIES: hypothetical protein [unclassified Flavobacterium]HRE76287.1 hypothetical protein [Flavobacterium sp.]